ncbi:BsuBI/PstI family type II restriction endonuclease [uncultured Methanobrevibacter sp.]|uniref:BsuBI/PstI family type II restriction endonuclease n=1 Tax=uncultured Methanobrevibacter sp. TaxID=253161 RepID=UPI00262E2D0B|nr:BsuBI/PstI family type II restriction endonuclease [uncultured Methanobrevibacter sp.]
MDNLDSAKEILKAIEMPERQQNDISAYTLLALAHIRQNNDWSQSTNEWIRIHDIIRFINVNYDVQYAENTRETIRKNVIHQFRDAAIVEDNGKSTNSPHYRYRLTEEFLNLIQDYNSPQWDNSLNEFLSQHESLVSIYSSKKELLKKPVLINGEEFNFSPGKHNELQKHIIEEFASRFAQGSECLYVGDTAKKDLLINNEKLEELGFVISTHDKMPDVILYCEGKNWIYFIEAVTSTGPMDYKRIIEINKLTENVGAGKIFITAFLDFRTFKRFAADLAWDSEVWIADNPNHLIHFNGDRFLGPR